VKQKMKCTIKKKRLAQWFILIEIGWNKKQKVEVGINEFNKKGLLYKTNG
jgi:hypothetical protein